MWWSRTIPKHLPVSNGPHVPGCADVMLGYGKNNLFMRLYYPSCAKKSDKVNLQKWIPWIPSNDYLLGISKVLVIPDRILRLVFWWYSAYNEDAEARIHIPVVYQDKPKITDKLKCVVMSHGMGGTRFLYSQICCELASHGFLVVALEHRDLSSCYSYYYTDETLAKKDFKVGLDFRHIPLGENHYSDRNNQILYRSEECGRAVDFLTALNGGNVRENVLDLVPKSKESEFKLDDFVGRLDLDDLVMMGHSFGGATALNTVAKRKEFKCCILLDPWMFPIKNEKLEEKVGQPILFLNTQTFHIESNVKTMSKFLTRKDREMHTILHTTHENQTDSVLVFGNWLNWFMKKLDPLTAMKINNALILNFLHKHVNCPSNVERQSRYLDEHKSNVIRGLTAPWA